MLVKLLKNDGKTFLIYPYSYSVKKEKTITSISKQFEIEWAARWVIKDLTCKDAEVSKVPC